MAFDNGFDNMLNEAGAPPDPDGPPPGIRARRLADIRPRTVDWLWPGRLPLAKLSLLVGDPGLGKSLVTLAIAAAVSRGAPWPIDGEGAAPCGDVILVSAEDDPADTIRPRLDAAGADCARIHILDGLRDAQGRPRPWTIEQVDALDRMVGWLDRPRLVVIDPVSAYIGGSTDSHNNSDVRALLAPLSEIASRHKVAVLCVSHLNKSGGPAVYRTNGSLAFVAAARAVYVVGKDENDPGRRLVLPIKANLARDATGVAFRIGTGADGVARVEWESDPVCDVDADAMLAGKERGRPDSERRDAEAWLAEALAEGPVAARHIRDQADAAGFAWRTVKRAKNALGVVSEREGLGWAWRLAGARGPKSQECQKYPSIFGPLENQSNQALNVQKCEGGQNSGFWHSSDGPLNELARRAAAALRKRGRTAAWQIAADVGLYDRPDEVVPALRLLVDRGEARLLSAELSSRALIEPGGEILEF